MYNAVFVVHQVLVFQQLPVAAHHAYMGWVHRPLQANGSDEGIL
jgi:hypothetical protein